MRVLLAALFFVSSLAHGAGCTFANSGTAVDPGAVANTSDFSTAAFTNAVNAGDLIVVAFADFNTNPTNLNTPTDTQTNTYTRQVSVYDSGQAHGSAIYTAKAASTTGAGSFTVTVRKSGQAASVLVAYWTIAAANWDGTTPTDGAGVTATSSTTSITTTTSATSVTTDCLIQAFSGRDTVNVAVGTPQTGFSASVTADSATHFTQVASASQQMAATTGGVTTGWPSMTNGSSRVVVMTELNIKGVGAAAAVPPTLSPFMLGP